MNNVTRKTAGISFESGDDRGRMIVSGQQTEGRYSVLEWTVAAGPKLSKTDARDFGPHLHRQCEETFLIQAGELEFLVDDQVVTLQAGDFVRVPPGVRHGYVNISGEPVNMLVTFTPGGFEELFLKYRTDQQTVEGAGFESDATRYHASEFGLRFP